MNTKIRQALDFISLKITGIIPSIQIKKLNFQLAIKKAVVASEPSVLPLSPSNREIALARAKLLATEAQG